MFIMNSALIEKMQATQHSRQPARFKNWGAGWRTIGGQKIYFRSRWEANYSRFLQWQLERGEILKWEHEPETFWFLKILRGTRSYLPDFRVTQKDGEIVFVEVKGYMDSKSRTKLKRMKIYHPTVKIFLADGKWFKANAKRLAAQIKEWEA